MKKMYFFSTLFISLGTFLFSSCKTQLRTHHLVTVVNNTGHDIILSETAYGKLIHSHAIPPHSQQKIEFSKNIDYIEAKIKQRGDISYHTCLPVNGLFRILTILEKKTLQLRAQ